MIRRLIHVTVGTLCLGLAHAAPSQAAFTLEGDATAFTVVAEGDSRQEIVTAIVKHFGIEMVGNRIEEGSVSGRFSGSLGQVLKSILHGNGYAIAYEGGRPIRITFPGTGTASTYVPSDKMAAAPAGEIAPAVQPMAPVAATQPLVSRMLEQGAVQQFNPGTMPPPPSPDAGAQQASMQQEIAAATAQALREVQALANDLKQTTP